MGCSLSPVTMVTKKMEALALTMCLFWASSVSYYHNRDRRGHLWEQISGRLYVAGECLFVVFITLPVTSLLVCVMNPLLTVLNDVPS